MAPAARCLARPRAENTSRTRSRRRFKTAGFLSRRARARDSTPSARARTQKCTSCNLCDPKLGRTMFFVIVHIRGGWAVISLSQFGVDVQAKLIEVAVKTAVHEF